MLSRTAQPHFEKGEGYLILLCFDVAGILLSTRFARVELYGLRPLIQKNNSTIQQKTRNLVELLSTPFARVELLSTRSARVELYGL